MTYIYYYNFQLQTELLISFNCINFYSILFIKQNYIKYFCYLFLDLDESTPLPPGKTPFQ